MTLGLAVISKTWGDCERVVRLYGRFFDEIYVQLNGTTKKPSEAPKNVHISTFKWVSNFSAARNELNKRIKTDFYVWLDTDDGIINPEGLRNVATMMQSEELDAVFMRYEYGFNDQKELIAEHWRERMIRTSHPFEWKGAIHETLISEQSPRMVKDSSVVIRHAYKTEADIKQSVLRNHEIMENLIKNRDEDPRTLYYLGRSYFMLERFREAAQTLLIYTKESGWDEQIYDAWMKIGDCLIMMDEHDKAINANLEAIKLFPHWPDAYLKMGDLYLHLEQPGRAIEWLKAGLSKQPPQTMEIIDPTLYTYRPLISMALAYFGQARVKDAKDWIDKAAKFQPRTKMFKSAYNTITTAYIEEQTIKSAAWLGKFVEEKGDIKKYIDGLPGFIKNDLRLRPLRVKAYPSKKWPERSIVFYCGEQWEEWGPDTLDKGMGGSEEAVVYLSRELAKLGWQVTVYNQRVEEYLDLIETETGVPMVTIDFDKEPPEEVGRFKTDKWVTYKPWETFNPEDEFDVFVAWRNPRMADALKIKARVKAVDMHDTPIGHQAFSARALASVDKIFLKSEFQRKLGNIPNDKCAIIPNGIYPKHFDVEVERIPRKVIYASSADRGLDTLVREIWPRVLEAVPDATLVWPYGWNSYDAMHKGNTERGKWKWELKRDMHNSGVRELGRLSHEDLAKEMMSCSVWAYPTEFPEIDCITAKKAQAAGCDAVTSGYAALQGSVLKDEEEIENIHLKPEEIDKFTRRLINALQNPITEKQREETAKKVLDKFAWSNIAKDWDKALK